MKTETRTVYVARDGAEFRTEALCRAHERKTCGAALIGLTEAQIEAARTRADPELADAFETFGAELRRARQATGQLKRKPGRGAQSEPGETAPALTAGGGVEPAAGESGETVAGEAA